MSKRAIWIFASVVLLAVGGILSTLPLSDMLNDLIGWAIVKH